MTANPRHGCARRWRTERGAILVQVAIALVVLVGLSSFVLDYGVMWTGRGQAQNAADAGALAGAISRAFDESGTPAPGGRTYTAATSAASSNQIFGESGGSVVSMDCPPWVDAARCVRVDVYRDGTNGSNPLPTYFAKLFGQTSQRVKATATATAIPANATNCLRPWAVPDIWDENRTPPWQPTSTFDRYATGGKNKGSELPTPPPLDDYTHPGYEESMAGQQVTLMLGNDAGPFSGGWFLAVDIPRADGSGATGGDRYRENIQSCNGIARTIGEYLNTETGAMTGPTKQGVADLIAQDPGASWDEANKRVISPCVTASTCAIESPRVVIVAVFDPKDWSYRSITNDTTPCSGGGQCVHVTNLFAFFIEGIDGAGNVTGRLMESRGEYDPGGWTVGEDSAFLWEIRLVN